MEFGYAERGAEGRGAVGNSGQTFCAFGKRTLVGIIKLYRQERAAPSPITHASSIIFI